MKLRFLFMGLLCLFLMVSPASAKTEFKIAMLIGPEGETRYHRQAIQEINTLLENRVDVEYQRVTVGSDRKDRTEGKIAEVMADGSVDCIIGIGFEQSEILVQLKRYHKPTIAATILDRRLQGLPLTPEGTSGIRNFNYIQTPFNIEKDLQTFQNLYNYKHLAVLIPAGETVMFHTLYSYFGKSVETVSPEARLSIVEIDPGNIAESVAGIPSDADAVYVLPIYPEEQEDQTIMLIQAVNKRRLPSFALIGEQHVRMGVMASIAPDRNFKALIRRIAINVLEILGGRDAGTLPVIVARYTDNFVVNVETLRKIDFFPGFNALEEARLLNLEKLRQGPKINLKGVILEALERNLALQLERVDTEIQAAETGISGSALLPQASVSTGVSRVDENRVEIARTVAAQTTWSATGNVSQTIFSDDLLTNHAIQKILLESQRYQEKAILLDTVITAANAYINLLFAGSNQNIQNNNLEVTRNHLDIARNKKALGSVASSEVNRWESEKASNRIRFNDARRDLGIAWMTLNQILNWPITREFSTTDIEAKPAIELLATDPEIFQLVGNFKQLEQFSDFLIQEADNNLPELKQITQSLKSEKRHLLNLQRAMYLPDVALTGRIDKIIEEWDAVQETSSDLDHPWTISLTATWPLFTGGSNKKQLAQSRIQLRRIRMEERDLRNRLHLNVRSNLETAAVSAREIELAERARSSAKKSFDIIQAGYAEGRSSVTDLVDAQNTLVISEQNAALAKYQFVVDFLTLERSIGRFHFLDSPDGKQAFIIRLRNHMASQSDEK